VEAWISRSDEAEKDRRGERRLRELLFDEKGAVWDLDRVVDALGNLVQQRATLLTGGRAADRSLVLNDPDSIELVSMECAELIAGAGDELLVAYKRKGEPRSGWFEVLRFEGAAK
jgi:hypothetical protein